MKLFLYYFFIFFIYSCLGWVVETINCSIMAKKKVLNRGFLIGPYIPIYGTAAIIMIFSLTEYKKDPLVLFCMASIYSGAIEYVASFLMEKIFSARWWNYTQEKFNINGRICLKNCLLFGLLGLVLIYVLNPFVEFAIAKIPENILMIISSIALVIFSLDLIVTIFLLSKLDIQIKNVKSDATQEIDKEMKKLLSHYKVLYRRLFRAFPKLVFNVDKGNILIDRVRSQFDELDEKLTEKKEDIAKIKKKLKELKNSNLNTEKFKEEKEKLKVKLREIRKRKIK